MTQTKPRVYFGDGDEPHLHALSLDLGEGYGSTTTVLAGNVGNGTGDASFESPSASSSKKSATVPQTALNIAKTCMGTGTLALPFATSQGGLVLNTVGLGCVTLWNIYAVDRLMKCLDLIPPYTNSVPASPVLPRRGRPHHRRTSSALRRLFKAVNSERVIIIEEEEGLVGSIPSAQAIASVPPQHETMGPPPHGTATFGKVTWYAMGPNGLIAMDIIMVTLLCGVIIAYEDAVVAFIGGTPFTTGSPLFDSVWTVLLIGPLSCVPNMQFLSKFSAMGIMAIFITFIVVAGYGIANNGMEGVILVTWDTFWPESIGAVSNWFGVVAFGFGVAPVAYTVQESMVEPRNMTKATKLGLFVVFITYVLIGDLISILFLPSVQRIEDDILTILPDSSIVIIARLLMTFVVIVTAPLLVVPCGELLEGRLGILPSNNTNGLSWQRIVVRLSICLFCTCVSVFVPGFVYVISFIGCCCVALVGFIFPPLLHLLLTLKHNQMEIIVSDLILTQRRNAMYLDVVMIVWGVIATMVTSTFTFLNLVQHASTQNE
eukprot:scaffold273332_cov51-Attheya_sp.AAC.2